MAVKTEREREVYEVYHVGPATTQKYDTTKRRHNTKTKKIVNTLRFGLCGDNPLATVRLSHSHLFTTSS